MGVTFLAPEGVYTSPAKLITKAITENGTYSAADDNANGFSSVVVNVEGGGGSSDFPTPKCTLNITIDHPEDVDFIDTDLRIYDSEMGEAVSISFESADIQASLNAEGYILDSNGRFRPTIWGVIDGDTEATFSYTFTNLVNATQQYDMADPNPFLKVDDWTIPCSATLVLTKQ